MDHIEKTVATFEAKLKEQEAEVAKTKSLINSLLQAMGRPAIYKEDAPSSQASLTNLRKDQFYGQAISTVLQAILEMRKAANIGPATAPQLYETMVAGGYKFDTADPENAKRGLRISLTKNSKVFHRLPGGEWGLLKWYPNAKAPKAEKAEAEPDTQETGTTAVEVPPAKVEATPQ